MVRRLIAGEDLTSLPGALAARIHSRRNRLIILPDTVFPELRSRIRNVWLLASETFRINSKTFLDMEMLMSDSIIRLQSATVDVVIKARPLSPKLLYWGRICHSPQDADSLTRPVANGRLDVDSRSL